MTVGTINAKEKVIDNAKNLKENEKKWTPGVMKAGWTAIPSTILLCQHELKLDATDINILMHIAGHWWFADRLPYPSKGHIAECMGIDARTVQRRIESMEKRGYVKRIYRTHHAKGSDTNMYDLAGLIEKLVPLAAKIVSEKEQSRVEKALRRRGQLRLVPDQTNAAKIA